jgi:predicted nucleotidyltransferase component of viral defense system
MGSAQNIRFHLSADEEMAFVPVSRSLLHPYDDAAGLECAIRAYALEEVLAEKLRAAAGQRRHAVARDIYDIAHLVRRGVDESAALSALPPKAAHKNVDLSGAAEHFIARRLEFKTSWERSLAYLVVDDLSFDEAFRVTERLLALI